MEGSVVVYIGLSVLLAAHSAQGLERADDWVLQTLGQLTNRGDVQDALIESLQEQLHLHDATIKTLQHDLQRQTQLANQQQANIENIKLLANQQQAEIDLLQQEATTSNQRQTELQQQVLSLQTAAGQSEHNHVDLQTQIESIEVKVSQSDMGSPSRAENMSQHHVKPVNATQDKLQRSDRLLLQSSSDVQPVAFHALVTNDQQTNTANLNMVFDKVLTNIGNAYHTQHGLFTAPVAGIYIFSASITVHDQSGSPHVEAQLLKNGVSIGETYARGDDGHRDQGSITVITQLEAGGEVWMKLKCCDGYGYDGEGYSSFTGALLYQL